MTDYAKDEPSRPTERKGRYIGTRYPEFKHNGQPCTVKRVQGPGLWVEFTPGGSQFLVHASDVE